MDHNEGFFDEIEKKTNVKKQDLFGLMNDVQNHGLSEESQVRQLIGQVSQLAGVPVSEEKEKRLVMAIMNRDFPMDISALREMFNQSK